MLLVITHYCGSAAELDQGYQEAHCLGGCGTFEANENNFAIYEVGCDLFEFISWCPGKEYEQYHEEWERKVE